MNFHLLKRISTIFRLIVDPHNGQLQVAWWLNWWRTAPASQRSGFEFCSSLNQFQAFLSLLLKEQNITAKIINIEIVSIRNWNEISLIKKSEKLKEKQQAEGWNWGSGRKWELPGRYPKRIREANVDDCKTSQWLRTTSLKAEMEGLTTLVQDQSLPTKTY